MRILYSKTHFKFGYTAGGSVAHMSGVLNALSNRAKVEIISNEILTFNNTLPITLVKPVGRSWPGEILYNLYFAPKLTLKLTHFKPDFVYHRFSGFSYATVRTCHRNSVPLILEFNSSDIWKSKYWSNLDFRGKLFSPIRDLFLRSSEKYILAHSNLIVVVSKALKQSLIELGMSEDKILVNPNGVDIQKFHPRDNKFIQSERSKFGLPQDKIIVGFSGTFGPWHGIPDLIEAIDRINHDQFWKENIVFLLIGEGGPLYQLIVNKLNKFNNVKFAGLISFGEVPNYLSVCDILVSPHGKTPDGREFFGSPTKLFEYMAMGKGIVASALGQISDILIHENNAVLYKPGDIDGLVNGIIYLATYHDIRSRLGENARENVVNHYTWDANIQRLLKRLF